MLGNWFQNTFKGVSAAGAPQPRGLEDVDLSLVTRYLCNTQSILPLSQAQASVAAGYLVAQQYQAGEIVFTAGDDARSNYMLWILDGEATIEAVAAVPQQSITMTVLEPGSTVGEMALMDGGRRSVTCTACTALRCAVLTRQALKRMAAEHPEVAVKLMSIICMGISVRLRDVTEKFKRYVVMSNAMRIERQAAPPNPPAP